MKTMTFNGEVFGEIPGFDGYFISRSGLALTTTARWNPRTRLLAQYQHGKRRYMAFTCGYRRISTHRAVALTWISNPRNAEQVNHIDGNKSNNSIGNLEWCTGLENIQHAFRTGLHARPEQPVIGVNPTTGDGVWAKSLTAAEHFGFSRRCISLCLGGMQRTNKGYEWSRAA